MQENDNALELGAASETSDKTSVVGIRFRACGKVYTFEAGDIELSPGTKVVIESDMGLSVGTVATSKYTVEPPREPFKKVIRVASEKDFEAIRDNRAFQDEARAFCVIRVRELNLPMKIVTTEITLDRKRLIFYFTADGRIDFRELVRDLASKFKTRIEMRQIGVRDEVKLLGGIGVCGRQTCCNLFLTNFEPVTIKMAKQQDLSINQSKLSGICGRLMCCLGYECRDGWDRETSREETGTGEASETGPEEADSGTVGEGETRLSADQTSSEEALAERGRAEQPRKEQTAAAPGDRDAGRRHSRRGHRRHKKPMQDKPAQDRPVNERPQQKEAAQKTEGEEKGKAFNRRRRFWKKKKTEQ
ncbi:MAG: stage 0 sporulation protein [Nitrospirae bacterium]|nr:stage 0 sporulation protein [Nitrospirota bacterium]